MPAEVIVWQCPHCGSQIPVSPGLTGKRISCKKCSGSFLAQPVSLGPSAGSAAPDTGPDTRLSHPTKPPPIGSMPHALPPQFGRYRIERPLGKGGMGAVYLAHDDQLKRQIALKTPRRLVGEGSEELERFYREARAVASIRHPNICPVFDVGRIGEIAYFTMAYIEGETLAHLAERTQPFPLERAATLVRTLALALEEAHRHGVVHRDLKPENIMIDERGEPVIMDFGLARQVSDESHRLTQTGALFGTLLYMSPEQARREIHALGPNTDIYSLGVVFYELLTGKVPFCSADIIHEIIAVEPPPPRARRPDIDPQLEAVCLTAMAKRIEARYASMKHMAAALDAWLQRIAPAPPGKPASPPAPARPSAARILCPGCNSVFTAKSEGSTVPLRCPICATAIRQSSQPPPLPPSRPAPSASPSPAPEPAPKLLIEQILSRFQRPDSAKMPSIAGAVVFAVLLVALAAVVLVLSLSR